MALPVSWGYSLELLKMLYLINNLQKQLVFGQKVKTCLDASSKL